MTELQIPEAEIRARWERGLSINAIAKALGVAHATIQRRVQAMGLTPHLPGSRPTEKVARLIEAWSNGVSVIEIAQELGLSEETVSIWVRDYELPKRRRGRPPNPALADAQALRDLWAEGLSAGQVARRLGVTPDAVSCRARALGLPIPNPVWLARGGIDTTGGRGVFGPAITEDQARQIAQRLSEGQSQSRIAAEMGLNRGTLRRFVLRSGSCVRADCGHAPAVVVAPAPLPVAPAAPLPDTPPLAAPPRLPRLRVPAGKVATVAPAEAAPPPELPPFDADLAKALTWRDVAVVARCHGKPLSLAQSRWHRVRAQVAA